MKKMLSAAFILLILLLAVACTKKPSESYVNEHSTDVNCEESDNMPSPFAELSDGDANSAFYQPCEILLDGIPTELIRLVDSTEFENWKSEHNIFEKAPSGLRDYPNAYSFIVEFDIPENEVLSALSVYLHSDDPRIAISEDDINIILSRDEKAIIERFASDYSIVIGNKIYSPQWIYENSVDSYKETEITADMIKEKLPLYSNIKFTDEAREAFQTKLGEFLKSSVNLNGYSIYADGEYFDLEWLASHTIQDYEEVGITVAHLQELLADMSALENSKEYEWIKSCYDRMTE